jgi:serine protease inhibitor
LDREKEKFNISKPYKDKIDVVNIVTSPEIEMLIICSENKYDEYCKVKSKMSPSDYCKQNLPKLKYDKKYETVKTYFNTPENL